HEPSNFWPQTSNLDRDPPLTSGFSPRTLMAKDPLNSPDHHERVQPEVLARRAGVRDVVIADLDPPGGIAALRPPAHTAAVDELEVERAVELGDVERREDEARTAGHEREQTTAIAQVVPHADRQR